jgi:hypothetical protein
LLSSRSSPPLITPSWLTRNPNEVALFCKIMYICRVHPPADRNIVSVRIRGFYTGRTMVFSCRWDDWENAWGACHLKINGLSTWKFSPIGTGWHFQWTLSGEGITASPKGRYYSFRSPATR